MITSTTRTTHTPTSALLLATALLALPLACSDDDSSATVDGSSTSTGTPEPPATSSSTAADSTSGTGSDTGTGTGTGTGSGTDTGSGTETAADSGTASESTTGAAGLEIAGQWLEEFAPGMGITHVIDETRWEQLADFGDATFHVDSYDNDARVVVAQGDVANEFYAGLWSRFDWTWDGDALYYCTAVYDAETAEDALAAAASDPADLAMGCGGFPWSALVPVR